MKFIAMVAIVVAILGSSPSFASAKLRGNGNNDGDADLVLKGASNRDNQADGRRREKLGGASPRAAAADCDASMDIKLYVDSPGYHHFKPDIKACKAGRAYVGSTEDGNCHVTLVPSAGNGKAFVASVPSAGNAAFAASVTCDDTGAVYSIGLDGNGAMVVAERLQEDYGPEIDPHDDIPAEERALLEARLATLPGALSTTSGLRGKVADQLRDLGDRFLTENQGGQDLQTKVQIDVLVLYTANAECRNAGYARECARNDTTQVAILDRINLAVTETNVAYDLSGINATLNLVHVAFDTYVEASVDAFGMALSDLKNNADGKLDQAHTLRTTYGADVVALIIDDAQYCGMAYLGPAVDLMFSVTAWNCATGYYSFGHEIGHNFGCNHDRGTINTTAACTSPNYNFGYRDPSGRFRSILAYSCRTGQCDNNTAVSCPRVQRFSNNYAGTNLYNGNPIGNAQNDNAKRINDVVQMVANYFPTVPVPSPTTKSPTQSPTFSSTSSPSTAEPSITPTTVNPTHSPSTPPSNAPTNAPTQMPTDEPSHRPSSSPSLVPIAANPTHNPSSPPSNAPTNAPTASPTTGSPTMSFPTTRAPTSIPTRAPTSIPTRAPTMSPTCISVGGVLTTTCPNSGRNTLCCSGRCNKNTMHCA
ncbi:hypothetical protein ACHAW5_000191 [Stephanodiscus triporus]|uniref:Peptidase M12B domain-containing protein n=1 Tax=Stephanodiscus triporus TaxID=2934178 RepID=A0ABD3NAU6_9STRA